jgi:hypothetical protein
MGQQREQEQRNPTGRPQQPGRKRQEQEQEQQEREKREQQQRGSR